MNWRKFFHRKSREGFTIRNSYLNDHGWYLSQERGKSMNLNRRSMPLLPYSLSDLIDCRITPDMQVFVRYDTATYRWFLHRAKHVSSLRIETSRGEGKSRFKHNLDLSLEEIDKYVNNHLDKFAIAIVDGPEKTHCLNMIMKMLNKNGVFIIIDDKYDRLETETILEDLQPLGFRALEFVNPAPLDGVLTATLFYRDGNVLGI